MLDNQVLIWSALMILLFVIFVLREAIGMQRQAGNNKLVEFTDEYDIYDWDED